MKSKKLILIPAILFVLIAVVFAACKKSGVDPIVVTDANGVPVTDENGKQIEVVPETEIVVVTDENGVPVTDENGKEVTTIRYIPQEVGIPVTDENGNAVKDENGNVLTTVIVVPSPENTTTDIVVTVPVTNDKGETQTDNSGNVVTETSRPSLPDNTPSNNLLISKTVSGSGNDKAKASAGTPDGGFVVGYNTASGDGSFAGAKANAGSGAICKYNKSGKQEWMKIITGSGVIGITDIAVMSDGSIIVSGETRASDFISLHGTEYDGFIQKYSASGDLIFTKGWGGSSNESFYSVAVGPDGNIYAAGFAYSQNGDCESLAIPYGKSKAVVVKFDGSGNVVAQAGFGGFGDYFSDIDINSSGDIFASGMFMSNNEYFSRKGSADGGVFKLKSDLTVAFAKSWGGTGSESFPGVAATKDGGCVTVGSSNSTDGDLASLGNKGFNDAILVKWNSDGSIGWAKSFTGSNDERFTDVSVTPEGDIVAVGFSASNTRDFRLIGNLGGTDAFVVRYSASGTLISAQGFGGSNKDEFNTVSILSGGQILAAGSTLSTDGYFKDLSPKSDGTKTAAMYFCFRI